MASAFAAPFAALCLAITALKLFSFLIQLPGGGPTTIPAQQASLLHSAAEVMLPLAAAAALFISFAFIHYRLSHAAAAPAAGAGNRRLSGLVFFVLCVSAGTLVFILFVQQDAGTGADHGAQAALRSLGLAALRPLPAAAAGTFFLGMTTLLLIVVAHVRAGGEGGGGGAADVAGDGPIQGPGRLINKVALGVAAALAFLMVAALYGGGAK